MKCVRIYYERNKKNCYEIPDFKSKWGTSFGYGKRFSFEVSKNPPPTSYNLKSAFTNLPGKKAYSFGTSREAYTKVFQKGGHQTDRGIPGPGQYNAPEFVGKAANKFTMRPKTYNKTFSI